MRILTTEQVRALDAYTIEHEPVASIDLMERACQAFVDWFHLKFDHTYKVGIVCGTGNNGGDGLGIARLLYEWGYSVRVWVVRGSATATVDFNRNLERLPKGVGLREAAEQEGEFALDECDVLIDAILGSGLSRPVTEGPYAQAIDAINNCKTPCVAVDIPSGLMADKPSAGTIVRARYTVSFQLPKLAFMLPDSGAYVGDWTAVDIGLNKDFIRDAETPYHYVRSKQVRRLLHRRNKHDHKGTFGHALLIAGSLGKIGAAVLAARGALRGGVGLLTTHVPSCGYPVMQTAVPEAMATIDSDPNAFTHPPELKPFNAIGVGPGLGRDPQTVKALTSLLESVRCPLVLDADALNILSENRHLLNAIPPGSILTPHPGEFARITESFSNGFERLDRQRALARSLNCVVILKGAHSSIAVPEGTVYFNSTGNPGMATGGTGDVLTGLLTALLAQNYSPAEAAITGVFLHGLSGDLARVVVGEESLTATDLTEYLGPAFLKIRRT